MLTKIHFSIGKLENRCFKLKYKTFGKHKVKTHVSLVRMFWCGKNIRMNWFRQPILKNALASSINTNRSIFVVSSCGKTRLGCTQTRINYFNYVLLDYWVGKCNYICPCLIDYLKGLPPVSSSFAVSNYLSMRLSTYFLFFFLSKF